MTMSYLVVCLSFLLLSSAHAAQPSAPAPIAAPLRPLQWGQLNFLATTDTHGWHGGHLQEAQYSADWGDYISFASHMRKLADERGVDLLLVDTGDRVDGNGLYDGSKPKGQYTYDIFKHQSIDILCVGNHELYKSDAAEREYNQTVPNFRGNYLASNLDIIDPNSGNRVPLSRRYRKFTTKNQGLRVLAFGFLFDFTGNANNTFVQRVEDTIKEEWFQDAIREDVDIFVVIGHVALRSPEYKALYTAIRGQNWDTPIQFFGGHSHIRDYMKYDSKAYALESGRYLETIGWMSIKGFPDKELSRDVVKMQFQRRYIDNNLFGYYHHTGSNVSTFPTKLGTQVSQSISQARKVMDLDKAYGCAPKDYWMNRATFPGNDSMFSWLQTQVLPEMLSGKGLPSSPRIAIINTGAARFDIFKGPFTRDTTFIVCPFTNKFRYIKSIPYSVAKDILPLLNSGGPVFGTAAERAGLMASVLPPPQQLSIKTDVLPSTTSYSDSSSEQIHLSNDIRYSGLIPGYTTKDDAGDDGDDTVHSPITFYRVPNCLEANIGFPTEGKPKLVDIVFLDFVQPWILFALKFKGVNVDSSDTLPYIEDRTFTNLMQEWIEGHWQGSC